MNRQQLESLLDKVRDMKDLQPEGSITHCNEAIRRTFTLAGFPKIINKDELANVIVDQITNDNRFREISTNEAFRAAQEGELVVAAHKYSIHGHVAMVYPSDEMKHSTSWDKDVPLVNNVGKHNDIMKVSDAFPVSLGEPSYFQFRGNI